MFFGDCFLGRFSQFFFFCFLFCILLIFHCQPTMVVDIFTQPPCLPPITIIEKLPTGLHSIKLSFRNINKGLRTQVLYKIWVRRPLSIFVKLSFIECRVVGSFLIVNLSLNQTFQTLLLYVSSGTKPEDSTDDSGNFWARGVSFFFNLTKGFC